MHATETIGTETPGDINDRLMRISEVAELFGVSERRVYFLMSEGHLRRVKIGRATRIRQSDVERIIAEGCE